MSMFIPENDLETAIVKGDIPKIVRAIAEGVSLKRLAAVKILGNQLFPDEIIFAVLMISTPGKKLRLAAETGWLYHQLLPESAAKLRAVVTEALAPVPQEPRTLEKQLIKAIVYHDNGEIIRLIEKENAQFHGFALELLLMLPELSKAAVLTLLRDGLSARLKAMIWGIFLKETEVPELLESLSYSERLKYTNLLMKILTGNTVSADEPWYPETTI